MWTPNKVELDNVKDRVKKVRKVREVEANPSNPRVKMVAITEDRYESIKFQQYMNNVPPSVRLDYLDKKKEQGTINDYEYNFYLNILLTTKLTPKQTALKLRINSSMVNVTKQRSNYRPR